MRRDLKDKNTRKLFARGGSVGLTIPKEILGKLKWRRGQKVVIKKRGQGILITDWE